MLEKYVAITKQDGIAFYGEETVQCEIYPPPPRNTGAKFSISSKPIVDFSASGKNSDKWIAHKKPVTLKSL